jgi:hypothetical protein
MAQKHLALLWRWTSERPSSGAVMSASSMRWKLDLDESFILDGRKFMNQALPQATWNILRRFRAAPGQHLQY